MQNEWTKRINELERAVKVICLTDHIRRYLEQTDPMALKQCQDAVRGHLDRLDKRLGGNAELCSHCCGVIGDDYAEDGLCISCWDVKIGFPFFRESWKDHQAKYGGKSWKQQEKEKLTSVAKHGWRKHECWGCGLHWEEPVKMAKEGSLCSITGEAIYFCPRCHCIASLSHPAEIVKPDEHDESRVRVTVDGRVVIDGQCQCEDCARNRMNDERRRRDREDKR